MTVWPRLAASAKSSRDSVGVSWTGSPRTTACRRWSSRTQVGPEVQALAWHALADAAEHALDAGAQLGVVVRLGDVVLGELVEEIGLVVAGVDRRQDDDRQVGAGLDLAGERQAVHPRHEQVDDQQIGPGGVEAPKGLVAIPRRRDIEAVEAQLLGERDQQVAVVVHEQDPWCRVPLGPPGPAAEHGSEYRHGHRAVRPGPRRCTGRVGCAAMRWPTATATNQQLARLDAGIILLILGLSVVSLAVWSAPGFPGVEDARALDITINVAAIFIGAGVAALAWVRWRDTGESVALYESSAFLALTVINVLMIGLVIVGREAEFGLGGRQSRGSADLRLDDHPGGRCDPPGHRCRPQPAA